MQAIKLEYLKKIGLDTPKIYFYRFRDFFPIQVNTKSLQWLKL